MKKKNRAVREKVCTTWSVLSWCEHNPPVSEFTSHLRHAWFYFKHPSSLPPGYKLGGNWQEGMCHFSLQTHSSNLQWPPLLSSFLRTSFRTFCHTLCKLFSSPVLSLCSPRPLDQMPSEGVEALEVEKKERLFLNSAGGLRAGDGTVGGLMPTRCPPSYTHHRQPYTFSPMLPSASSMPSNQSYLHNNFYFFILIYIYLYLFAISSLISSVIIFIF